MGQQPWKISGFLLVLLLGFGPVSRAYRILLTVYPNSKSHKHSVYPLGQALAQRGHEVAIFCEVLKRDKPADVPSGIIDEQIVVRNKDYNVWTSFGYRNNTDFQKWQWLISMGPWIMPFPHMATGRIADAMLSEQAEDFDRLLFEADGPNGQVNKSRSRWDLVIVDTIFTHSGIAAAEKLRHLHIPYVLMATSDFENHVFSWKGYPTPTHSYVPYFIANYDWDHRRLTDRVWSIYSYLTNEIAYRFFVPLTVRSATQSVTPKIDYRQLFRESSGYFSDYPDKLNWPRPTGHEMLVTSAGCPSLSTPIETGKKTRRYEDSELERFLGDPNSKGTIILAFGTQVDWGAAPREAVEAMTEALKRFPDYRVIWQFDRNVPVGLPEHIQTLKWLPQTALLADLRTKLFISHGGLKSFKENLCNGMPVIYLPFFGDQPKNGHLAKRHGYGDVWDKFNLTTEGIHEKIAHFLRHNDRFKRRALRARAMWLDQVIPRDQEGAFRTEFLIRHGGLPRQMRNRSNDLYWFQYYHFDLAAVLINLLIFVYVILMSMVRMLFCTPPKQ